jgi:hypothetical protein
MLLLCPLVSPRRRRPLDAQQRRYSTAACALRSTWFPRSRCVPPQMLLCNSDDAPVVSAARCGAGGLRAWDTSVEMPGEGGKTASDQ